MSQITNTQSGSLAIITISAPSGVQDFGIRSVCGSSSTASDSDLLRPHPVEMLPERPTVKSIGSFLDEFKEKPGFKESMGEARKWVAEEFYSEKVTLKSLRLKAGLSQSALAEMIGTSQPQVAKLERGVDPQLSTVAKLAKALGLTTGEMAEVLLGDS